MINPYSGVNWETALHIVSCSHEHCETQEEFETLMSGGLDHVAISNYYPVGKGTCFNTSYADQADYPDLYTKKMLYICS